MSHHEGEKSGRSKREKVIKTVGTVGATAFLASIVAGTAYSYVDFFALNPSAKIEREAESAFPRTASLEILDKATADLDYLNKTIDDFQKTEPALLRSAMLSGESSMPIPKVDSLQTKKSIEIFNAEQERLAKKEQFKKEKYGFRHDAELAGMYAGSAMSYFIIVLPAIFGVSVLIDKIKGKRKKQSSNSK